jgi:hypothetical protein
MSKNNWDHKMMHQNRCTSSARINCKTHAHTHMHTHRKVKLYIQIFVEVSVICMTEMHLLNLLTFHVNEYII